MAKNDPRILKSEAALALDKGKHKKALEAYLALEELEPEDGQWPRRASDMYRRLGQQKLAIAALERAADKYVRAGFMVKAIAVCKMILQLEPAHPAVQQRLAALTGQGSSAEPGASEPGDPDVPATRAPLQPVAAPPARAQQATESRAEPVASPRPVPPPVPRTARAVPPPVPPRAPAGPPPVPGQARVSPGASPAQAPQRWERARTIPADAPLDSVSLGEVVPGAIPELINGQDSGITEIPIAAATDAQRPLGPKGERALRETPLLSSLGPDAMQRLISEVSLIELAPGQVLFREGEPGRTLYIIAEGAVSVISEGPPRVHLSQLNEGDFFGEIAIVTNHARSATIEADPERGAHVLAIERNVIGALVDEEPGVLQALLRFLRDRLVDRLIHTSPLFAPYAGQEGRSLASRFRFLEVQPGALILEQDRKATGLFVLLAGQLEAVRTEDGKERRLGTMGPGGICGEMSLLANQPSLFTMRARSKIFVLQLPAAVFREVIMTHPQVLMYVAELAEERRQRYEAVVAGDEEYETGRISLV